jgi:Ser/Thr protein kinase RdoA (MazF antagonist)
VSVETVRRAANRFGWDDVIVVPVGRGNINDSFFVTAGAGEYVLQRLNQRVFGDIDGLTTNLLSVCGALSGGVVPQPVPAPPEQWVVDVDGERWRAWCRVPGEVLGVPIDEAPARSAGALLGQFHGQVSALDPSGMVVTLPRFHDLRGRRGDLEAAIAADRFGRAAGVSEEVDRIRGFDPLVDVAEDLVSRVPQRVAHFDCKLDNILFRHGRAVCLVDLDTVMPGAWFWDLGDLLRTATANVSEETTDPSQAAADGHRYEAVVAGYLDAVPANVLTTEEIEATRVAGAISAFEQAVRFLTDWLMGDIYFRTTRSGQNCDRAQTQLNLLASMPAAASFQ